MFGDWRWQHSVKWSLRGPVDISLHWRTLFIQKAKRSKDVSRSHDNIVSTEEEKSRASREIQKLLRKPVWGNRIPEGGCHSRCFQPFCDWTACPSTYQEQWGKHLYSCFDKYFYSKSIPCMLHISSFYELNLQPWCCKHRALQVGLKDWVK